MKKVFLLVSALLCILLLTGCQCEHEWLDATCLAPKICSKCAVTEGEALGHSWEDATCTAPKHCIACDMTEGNVLEHTWDEASCSVPKTCTLCQDTQGEALPHTWDNPNYQDNKICVVCGGTDGKPLTPYFEEHGLKINMEENVVYKYVTSCYDDTSKKTTADLVVYNHRVFNSDKKHPAKDGYEWHTLEADFSFWDTNAAKYGWTWNVIGVEYYENSPIEDIEEEATYSVNYHGQEYPECYSKLIYKPQSKVYRSYGNSNQSETGTGTGFTLSICVPVGYDGSVLAFYDSSIKMKEGSYLHENVNANTLYFRIK